MWPEDLPCSPLQGGTHQQVFWFYVSVDNIEAVQVLDGTGQVEEHAAGVSLCVFVRGDDCIKKIAALEKKQCCMTDTTGITPILGSWNSMLNTKYLY